MTRTFLISCLLAATLSLQSVVAHAEPRSRRQSETVAAQAEWEEPAEAGQEGPQLARRSRARGPTLRPKTSLVLPIALLSVGGPAVLGGAIFFALRNSQVDDCDGFGSCSKQTRFPAAGAAGVGFIVGGVVLTLVGLVVLPVRMMARQNARAMGGRSHRVALAPWFERKTHDGMSVGFSSTLRF